MHRWRSKALAVRTWSHWERLLFPEDYSCDTFWILLHFLEMNPRRKFVHLMRFWLCRAVFRVRWLSVKGWIGLYLCKEEMFRAWVSASSSVLRTCMDVLCCTNLCSIFYRADWRWDFASSSPQHSMWSASSIWPHPLGHKAMSTLPCFCTWLFIGIHRCINLAVVARVIGFSRPI